MSSNDIAVALDKLFSVSDPHSVVGHEELVQLIRDREEAAYVRGAEMARRLLRLQLGLGTMEDHK